MASKADFTQEEWNKLLDAMMMAGLAVTAAEPSGLWGLLKEGLAGGWALLQAKTSSQSPLIRALVEDFGAPAGRGGTRDRIQHRLAGAKLPEIKDRAIEAVREAAAIVDAKAPAEAGAFKEWLKALARGTAEASNEGGFLGFGGVKVSEAEKAALGEIDSALGLSGAATTTAARGVQPGSPRMGP